MHAAVAIVWMYRMEATLVLALEILMEAILTFLMIANKSITQPQKQSVLDHVAAHISLSLSGWSQAVLLKGDFNCIAHPIALLLQNHLQNMK